MSAPAESKKDGKALAAIAVAVVALLLAGTTLALNLSSPAPPAKQPRLWEIRLVISAIEPHNESMGMEEVHVMTPSSLSVAVGDRIRMTVVNMDEHNHSAKITELGVDTGLLGGGEEKVLPEFTVDTAGVYEVRCGVPPNNPGDCGEDHEEIVSYLVVS